MRAFEVFATAQTGSIGTGTPGMENRFMLLLDLDARRAVAGGAGAAQLVPFSISSVV